MSLTIRPAERADAAALAHLHDATWRDAYAEILPRAAVGPAATPARTRFWTNILARLEAMDGVTDEAVAIARSGDEPVGFSWWGAQRRRPPARPLGEAGELFMLYVLPAAQRRGVGQALLRETGRALAARGFFSLVVWCVAANDPARRFYAAAGGEIRGRRREAVRGGSVEIVAFGWDEMDAFFSPGR